MAESLTTVFEGYYDDLVRLGHLVATDLQADTAPGVDLLGKLALETARLVVYEQFFLLPAVRDAMPDGVAVARREAGRLADVADGMRRLERLAPGDPSFRRGFGEYLRAAQQLGEQRSTTLLPALRAALGGESEAAAGTRVTPTVEPGSTHSHPAAAKLYASDWPRPGFLDDMMRVFADEVSAREPGAVPVGR